MCLRTRQRLFPVSTSNLRTRHSNSSPSIRHLRIVALPPNGSVGCPRFRTRSRRPGPRLHTLHLQPRMPSASTALQFYMYNCHRTVRLRTRSLTPLHTLSLFRLIYALSLQSSCPVLGHTRSTYAHDRSVVRRTRLERPGAVTHPADQAAAGHQGGQRHARSLRSAQSRSAPESCRLTSSPTRSNTLAEHAATR